MLNLTVKDVVDKGDIMLVDIDETKNYKDRQYVINAGVISNVNFLDIIRKYLCLRSRVTTTDRFLVGYRKGKCISLPVGINTIGGMPKKIADFLGLENSALYTGHTFRRTSATLLVEAGADIIALKQHGRWESSKVAEAYLEESLQNKRKIANGVLGNNFSVSNPIAPTNTIITRTPLATISNSNPVTPNQVTSPIPYTAL